jgi:FHS family L-fucose permease-like MFS transporter
MLMSMQKPAFTERRFLVTFIFVTSLFFLWGTALSMSDVLNKHFQTVLHLSKAESGLIQFSVFGAYFLMSIPAGLFMKRFGYKAGVLLGLFLFASGTFLFVPAANQSSFGLFRIALFILGCGMATLETVAHPFVAELGDQRTSDRRINFSQAFNAIGTMIGPALGTYFLLKSLQGHGQDLSAVRTLYSSIGIVIAVIAIAFSFVKLPVLSTVQPSAAGMASTSLGLRSLFKQRHFVWAVIAQFFNVGAQAGTWAFFINYGHEKMSFSNEQAGNYMVLFMGMMVLGRITGTFLMKLVAPNNILAGFAAGNILMCLLVAFDLGWASFIALLMINFFFSIMFPTIFSLGLKNLGSQRQRGSSFIAMGVGGGAFFPLLMGLVANQDVAKAYLLPIICYVVIFLFGYKLYHVDTHQNIK